MQGPQTGAFEAVLIEPGFQRRQRAQDADTRAFPAALPHMADHGVDHVHEAHGPPGRVELFEGRVQYPRAVGRVAGHTDDGRSGPRQFRHDVPYGLAGIVRGLAEQEGRALPDPVGEGIEHDRQVFLIRLGSGVVKELARQIKPRMGPDAADDADPFILSHGCLRFPPRKGIFRGVRRPGRFPGGLFGRSEPFAAFGVEIAFQL